MAKHTITMGCGHEDTIELYGSGKERKSRVEYLQRAGICKKCYVENKRAEEAATPLTINIDLMPINQKIMLSFTGNTMPVKDDIKALGYRWGHIDAAGALGMLFSDAPPKRWHKIVNEFADVDTELKRMADFKLVVNDKVPEIDLIAWKQVKDEKEAAQKRINEALANIQKPARPAKLPAGVRWNEKIYGRAGNKAIYLNNEKVNLTDEEASEVETWLVEIEKYNKAVEQAKKDAKK